MMMNNDSKSNEEAKIVDSETLVSQTQDRLWRALKRRFQYDVSLQSGQEFLLNHVSTKIPLVITYADLVGSTNMSMTLPADKLTTIIRAFTYEMSQVIYNHKGYVLKYVGDAVISHVFEHVAFVVVNNLRHFICESSNYSGQFISW